MNKTKTIYFLSAVVLIIGCYALNLSYSLFVQTEEKEIVTSNVPNLAAELGIASVEVEAGKEYLLKQTIKNTGSADINYAINASSASTTYTVKVVSDGTTTYTSTGSIEANTNKDTYLVVSNTGTETITVNFNLDKNYTTLTNNLTTNIDNDNAYTISLLPYSDNKETLDYHIINQYVNSELYSGSINSDISSLFTEGATKVTLPLESTFSISAPNFTGVATEELGLFQTEDDYGTSYYYRGASTVNYVSFAGFTWRIIRINGDGSIRLILNDNLDQLKREGETSVAGTDSVFNTNNKDNAYIGFMYGETDKSYYYKTHTNTNNSVIKETLETFYEEYLNNEEKGYDYEDYLTDTLFCGDKTMAAEEVGSDNTVTGYGENETYYSAVGRLLYSTKENAISTATPTLECAKDNEYTYSRYTSILDTATTTSTGVSINTDLTYPIGLITADEVVMAGGWSSTSNTKYYLEDRNSSAGWWTMTPAFVSGSVARNFFVDNSQQLSYSGVSGSGGVRPVINLKAGILVDNGDGTSTNPYTVKLN